MSLKKVYLLPFILIFFASCIIPRYMYSPSAQNVPVLVKKGDSKLSASYSNNILNESFAQSSPNMEKDKGRGFDIQSAVAITDHFAIQANYYKRSESNYEASSNTGNNNVVNYKRKLTEIGIGYFTSLHRKDKVMLQVFSGAGNGMFSFTDITKDRNNNLFTKQHQAGVFKFYVQPAMMFRIKENFALSVATRLSILKFSNIKTDYPVTELDNYNLDGLAYGSHTFFEPAFINTFGFNKLRGLQFEYQLGFSFQVNERKISYRELNFSLGILLDIPKIFKAAPDSDKD